MHAGATLADPMCGSGTFLIEAALMATNTAPGLFRRRFPFQGWHDFDRQAYARVCAQAKQAQTPWEGKLLGNEIHPGALSLAFRCGTRALGLSCSCLGLGTFCSNGLG